MKSNYFKFERLYSMLRKEKSHHSTLASLFYSKTLYMSSYVKKTRKG